MNRNDHAAVAAAGYVEKTAHVNGVALCYAEGPPNGPPLVLLHAQLLDWFSYHRVLPALAARFHVVCIDYPGHGKTVTPPDYPMTAARIGADLADFIDRHIGAPVFISGNSSGGLLSAWLAAYRPHLVKAALLEDRHCFPPNTRASSRPSPTAPSRPATARCATGPMTSSCIGSAVTRRSFASASAPVRRSC